ncbi:hypothetical protein [Pseudochryseolinea flava]|uniref:Capsule assembly Wzi family protein n=1 Tax=Pseudochryseolinea flava TaxID=2059302 RepID=A0A364XYD3_9BACT|nr:hypothetical protein [Pseudochryseolinea flava]RAV98429.1 hypothetical protein DQQ10_24195 [Pseudochryseolinea flava]
MLKSIVSALVLVLLLAGTVAAQSNYVPYNEDYYHLIDRYEVKTGQILPHFFSTVKPYKRQDVVAFMDSIKSLDLIQSLADQFNYDYVQNDSWEWSSAETSDSKKPFLKHFYRKKADLYSVNDKWFDLHINPVLYVGAGKDSRVDDMLFVNTRGAEVRGMIDKKVGFYTTLTDNQMMMPEYVQDELVRTDVVPHEGFWKQYKEGRGVDFLQARGYITFEATRHINLQFGHDRFFIGNGLRSLVFSDNAPPAWFLKGNVKIWKLNYLFLVNQMTADVRSNGGGLIASNRGYPNKFTALHHISLNIGKKLNIGLFEAVIFSEDDSTGTNAIRLDYFNPIIFYRAIEQQNGSSDNVLLGFDFKWNALRKLSFYGQFMLDEFVLREIKAGNGWWANKFGIQAGAKYVDAFGISNLDLQGEINIVRPYTYTHNTNYGNYTSYRQSIAHPLGANFKEIVGIVRYQPIPKLNVIGKLIMMQTGRDSVDAKKTYGGNLLVPNTNRYDNYNNKIAQGISNDVLYGSLTATFQFRHNVFIEGTVVIRRSESPVAVYNKNASITSLALRWNIARRQYEF